MAADVQGGGAAGYGGDYVSLGAIPLIQCSIVRCGRRAAVGGGRPCDVRRRLSLNTTHAASDLNERLRSTSHCLHTMYNRA